MSSSTPAADRDRSHDGALVGFVSLGCPKNLVDAELMMGLLRDAGFTLVADPLSADVVVVNTCAFIREAEQEAIETILALAAENRARPLVVAGCLPQRRRGALLREMPEIAGLVGPGRLAEIVPAVRAALAGGRPHVALGGLPSDYPAVERERTGSPYSAYVKIAEGCDHHCAFCLIPALRGPQRSRPAEDIIAEARSLAGEGTREIILVAQDTTAYGIDLVGRPALDDLLCRLRDAEGPEWIRVLYTHPVHWTEGLIDVFTTGGRVLPYIDIPIQHASAPVLKAMGRETSASELRSLLARLRERIPHLVLRTTVMTGHPGEGPEEFAELLSFMREFPFDRLGAFAYSPEAGTTAARLGSRPARREALQRRRQVLALQHEIAGELLARRKGTRTEALIEGADTARGLLIGRSYGEAPDIDGVVRVRLQRRRRARSAESGPRETDEQAQAVGPAEPGDIIPVLIIAAGSYDLTAVPVADAPGCGRRRG